jgi:hypothetical protein
MDQNEQIRQAFQHVGPFIFLFWSIIYIVKITLYVIPSWQIAKKAGLSGPVALLAAIPLIGRLVMLYVIAFTDWKVAPVATTSPYYPPTYPPAPPPSYQPPPIA